jgi:SecD/SecF fusion protein
MNEKADEEVNKLLFGTSKHYSADMTYEKFVNAYEGKTFGITIKKWSNSC